MDFTKFVEWAFMALVSGACTGICYLLWSLLNSIKDLNIQIALIIERAAREEKRSDRIERRISDVERTLMHLSELVSINQHKKEK